MSVSVVLKSVFDDKGIKQAEKAFAGLGPSIKNATAGLAAALGGYAIANFAKDAIMSASNLSAELEGVRQAFGSSAVEVENFAKKASELVGVSETVALQAAKNFGGFASAAGISGKAAADFSINLVQAAGDLASFADVPVEETLAAISSGLAGQSEPLRKFQIFIDDTTMKSYAMSKGLGDTYSTMTQGEKTILRQQAILEQMGIKQGDFVKYQDTFGNALKTVQSQFAEMQAEIGTAMLPAMESLLGVIKDLIPVIETELLNAVNSIDWEGLAQSVGNFFTWIADNLDEMAALAKVMLDLAPLIIGVTAAFTGLKVALEVAKVAQLLFNTAVLANPYVFAATAIILALAGITSGIINIANAMNGAATSTDDATSATNDLNNADLSRLDGALYQLQQRAMNTAAALSTAASIIPASPTGSRVMPSNPKPGQKYTWYNYSGPDGQAVWWEQTWTGTEWTKPKKITYTAPGSTVTKKDTTAERFAKVQAVIKKAQKAIASAEENYARTRFEINRNYQEQVLQLEKSAADQQANLVAQSKARITDAFRSASAITLSDLFDTKTLSAIETTTKQLTDRLTVSISKTVETTSVSSVDSLISGIRDKLAASKQLIANASALAGEGFSQTFIEQVISAGTDTGNAMADAILKASPETKYQLKSLYGELETLSESGAQTLADNLYNTYGLATSALTAQSKAIADQLKLDLDAQNKALAQSLADAGYAFGIAIKDIKDTFLSDLEGFDGWFAGLGSTIDQLLAKMAKLSGTSLKETQAALTAADSGTVLAGATITADVAVKQIQNAQGLVVDSMNDVAGTAAYLQARIAAANKYIASASSNAIQDASAAAKVSEWTTALANLQGSASSGSVAGTVININVKTDTTQSQAMVGKTIGNIVTKYVTTGGQVLVSGNA